MQYEDDQVLGEDYVVEQRSNVRIVPDQILIVHLGTGTIIAMDDDVVMVRVPYGSDLSDEEIIQLALDKKGKN